MPMLLSEWRMSSEVSFRSNIGWNTTVGATNGRFANFQHSHAVVWSLNRFAIRYLKSRAALALSPATPKLWFNRS